MEKKKTIKNKKNLQLKNIYKKMKINVDNLIHI